MQLQPRSNDSTRVEFELSCPSLVAPQAHTVLMAPHAAVPRPPSYSLSLSPAQRPLLLLVALLISVATQPPSTAFWPQMRLKCQKCQAGSKAVWPTEGGRWAGQGQQQAVPSRLQFLEATHTHTHRHIHQEQPQWQQDGVS